MSRSDPGNVIEHHDCRQMALALEGLAGCLHSGRPVDAKDLQTAAKAAEWVWEAGPKPNTAQARDFETARAHFVRATQLGSAGAAREASIVEKSAQQMAMQLRWMAQELDGQPPRKELPTAATGVIVGLSTKYGRYGIRSAAA